MPFTASVYLVLIASPSDLSEERQVAAETVYEWNALNAESEQVVLLPVRWETHSTPRSGIRPQQAINEQLVKRSDVLIGMFWTKLGTHTGVAESGTVEEIDNFVSAGKPAMLYFSDRPVPPATIDLEQQQKLRQFKEATHKHALVEQFSNPNQLQKVLMRHLTQLVRDLKSKDPDNGKRNLTGTATDSAKTTASQKELRRKLYALVRRINWIEAKVGFPPSNGELVFNNSTIKQINLDLQNIQDGLIELLDLEETRLFIDHHIPETPDQGWESFRRIYDEHFEPLQKVYFQLKKQVIGK